MRNNTHTTIIIFLKFIVFSLLFFSSAVFSSEWKLLAKTIGIKTDNKTELVTHVKAGGSIKLVIVNPHQGFFSGENTSWLNISPDRIWISEIDEDEHVFAAIETSFVPSIVRDKFPGEMIGQTHDSHMTVYAISTLGQVSASNLDGRNTPIFFDSGEIHWFGK